MEVEVANSSSVQKFQYDATLQELRVWFKNGQVYDYFGVPDEVAQTFKTLSEGKDGVSVGKWFGETIRKTYVYQKVKKLP